MPTDEQQGTGVPEDFEAFEAWRNSPKEAPAAQEETPEPEPAPDSDPETPQEDEDKGEKDKAVKGVQKRIDELTKARREAERKAEEAERKLAEIQGSRPADKNAPANPTEPAGKPKIEDFPTIEAYYEALTDFKIEQREKAAAAKESASAAQKDWEERADSFKSQHADYDEAIDSVKIPNNSPSIKELSQAVFAGGPELLYQLAKAPDEVARIAALPPIEALLALGEFKAKIPAPEKQPQKVSSAPKPPARVGGTAPTAKAIDDPNLEYADFEKLRNAQERRRR